MFPVLTIKIYSHPERALHEFIAHDTICGLFDTLNKSATTPYRITRHAYQTPTNRLTTAFEIETFSGDGGLLVVFNAEYDALPAPTELRHACGHNLIATASAAAFISATSALRASGAKNWRLRLLGTPAEEAAGGKLKLLKQGAYREAAACVMVHPVPLFPTQDGVSWTSSLASQRVSVVFDGKPSHGALAPWEGRNALDAFVNAYVSISTLRQQLMPHQRICGIITEGGVAANVIPSVAKAQFSVRSKNKEELDALMGKVKTCLMAGAVSSGCEATITV